MEGHDIIIQKIDNLREITELKFKESAKEQKRTNDRLDTLNGQVAKNTQFRIKSKVWVAVALGLLGFIIPITQEAVKELLSKYFAL